MGAIQQNDISNNYFLLPAYIFFETIRAVLTYVVLHSHVSISSTFVTLCSESIKLIFTIAFMLRWISGEYGSLSLNSILHATHLIVNKDQKRNSKGAYMKAYIAFMVPSSLYLINNLVYLIGLKLTTPALLYVAIIAELPFTAIFHHFLIRPQRNLRSWLSLGALSVGLLLTNIPVGFGQWLFNEGSEEAAPFVLNFAVVIGPVIGLVMAIISGFTSVYMETIMKQNVPFWVAQFWLYAFGSAFAGITYTLWDGHIEHIGSNLERRAENFIISLLQEYDAYVETLAVLSVIATTSASGLCVANILRKKDNLVKLVGVSASIVTIIVVQCVMFTDLRVKIFNMQTIIGTGIVCISTWLYSYFKMPENNEAHYSLLGEEEEIEFKDHSTADGSKVDDNETEV